VVAPDEVRQSPSGGQKNAASPGSEYWVVSFFLSSTEMNTTPVGPLKSTYAVMAASVNSETYGKFDQFIDGLLGVAITRSGPVTLGSVRYTSQ
jgi:hypothetical protein